MASGGAVLKSEECLVVEVVKHRWAHFVRWGAPLRLLLLPIRSNDFGAAIAEALLTVYSVLKA